MTALYLNMIKGLLMWSKISPGSLNTVKEMRDLIPLSRYFR